MSSPATIPRAFINMSSPIIDLTISPMSVRTQAVRTQAVRTQAVRTQAVEVVFISDTEDEINDPSHNHNDNNYRLNDNNNNHNSTLGFDNQNIFNSSTRHSSNNNQDSSNNSNNYNLRSGLAGLGTHSSNGGGPIRNTSTRSSRAPSAIRGLLNLMLNVTVSSQASNNNHRQHHTSAFHPYENIPPMASFFESTRANTNINNNDIQILNTPPPSSSRRRTNNSPKPTTLVGHARDLNDSHTLVCADCNELLHEKLWALSSCGHVVCGSCVDKYLEKKRFHCPSCKKSTKPTTLLQLYV